jgi:hypothetical protein
MMPGCLHCNRPARTGSAFCSQQCAAATWRRLEQIAQRQQRHPFEVSFSWCLKCAQNDSGKYHGGWNDGGHDHNSESKVRKS